MVDPVVRSERASRLGHSAGSFGVRHASRVIRSRSSAPALGPIQRQAEEEPTSAQGLAHEEEPDSLEARARGKVRAVRERGGGSLLKGAALTGKDMAVDSVAEKVGSVVGSVTGAYGRAKGAVAAGKAKLDAARERGGGSVLKGAALTGKDMAMEKVDAVKDKVASVRERGGGSLLKGAALTGKDMAKQKIAEKVASARETVMGAYGRGRAKLKAGRAKIKAVRERGDGSLLKGAALTGKDMAVEKVAEKVGSARDAVMGRVNRVKELAGGARGLISEVAGGGKGSLEGKKSAPSFTRRKTKKKSAPTPGAAHCCQGGEGAKKSAPTAATAPA